MTRVEMKRQLKALANNNGYDVIRITFNPTKEYNIASMHLIDKKFDVILRKVYWCNKGENKIHLLEDSSGLMVLRKDYIEEEGATK